MRWFKHMTASADDEKLALVLDECGLTGYGFFWRVLEIIAAQVDESGKNYCAYTKRVWCNKLAINHQAWSKMIASCKQAGLFNVSDEGQLVKVESPNILKFRDEWSRKKARNSGVNPESLRSKDTDTDTDTDNTPSIPLEGDGEQKPTSLSLFTLASAEPDVVQGTSPSAETGKGAQRSKRKVKGADLPPYTAWFEECWKAYPRRSGKANAWRAFYELDELGEIPPDMVQRIKNRCFEPDWQRGIKNPGEERYIPHMATWLHARGWEDDGCESVVDHRNTPEDIRRNEIMGLYNFGMPMKGDTLDQAKQRSIEMNLALDAAGL